MSILQHIEDYMSGDAWESLCVQCYKLRYQAEHYTDIPAVHRGDAGIEGFTRSGIVHQCYCPERNYTDNELYEHLRDKMTADIDKLISADYAVRLSKLGVPQIREWHFNIPEYKDSRIIEHANKKRGEVIALKCREPSNYSYLADDFDIVVKVAQDFAPEISRIIRTTLTDLRLNLAVKHNSTPDWSKCESDKVANIRRKIKAVMNVGEDDGAVNELVGIYTDFYISGLEIMNSLRVDFPEIFEELYKLEQSYKLEVRIKTLMNTDKSMNRSLFNNILSEFEQKLKTDFSRFLLQSSIEELKQDMVASWLADCSMEFKNT